MGQTRALTTLLFAVISGTSTIASAGPTSTPYLVDSSGATTADPSFVPVAPGSATQPPRERGLVGVVLADESPRLRLLSATDTGLFVGGYLETYYSYNLNRPQNGITEFRAFDNRHNTFSIQAAVIDIGFRTSSLEARLALQTGTAASTYFGASESSLPGTALTPASDASRWQAVQQAYLAWSPLAGKYRRETLVVDAGLFLSPIGPENLATHDNNHWSHSPLFFALPFYHTGARVRWSPVESHAVRFAVYNGWNNATDNNPEKSISVDYAFTPSDALTVGATYFGGVERPVGAVEGRAFRHLLDGYAVWSANKRLRFVTELDGGIEPNRLGLSGWFAASLSSRVMVLPWLFVAARGSAFFERRAEKDGVSAAPIAIPSSRVAAATFTLETRPTDGLSVRLEARHDNAASPIYFARGVVGDGSAGSPYITDARYQTTLTMGATAWF